MRKTTLIEGLKYSWPPHPSKPMPKVAAVPHAGNFLSWFASRDTPRTPAPKEMTAYRSCPAGAWMRYCSAPL